MLLLPLQPEAEQRPATQLFMMSAPLQVKPVLRRNAQKKAMRMSRRSRSGPRYLWRCSLIRSGRYRLLLEAARK